MLWAHSLPSYSVHLYLNSHSVIWVAILQACFPFMVNAAYLFTHLEDGINLISCSVGHSQLITKEQLIYVFKLNYLRLSLCYLFLHHKVNESNLSLNRAYNLKLSRLAITGSQYLWGFLRDSDVRQVIHALLVTFSNLLQENNVNYDLQCEFFNKGITQVLIEFKRS